MALGGRKALCKLTIDAQGADQSNFPWLFTEDNLPSVMFDADGPCPALNGGGDIVFTSDKAGATRLPIDLRRFVTDNNPANGYGELWVQIPSLSVSGTVDVYVHWGKTGETQPARDAAYGAEAVWNSGFAGVWHLDEDPTGGTGAMKDMTSNDNHGTPSGFSGSDTVDGEWGKALSFTSGKKVLIPDSSTLEPTAGTLEAVYGDRTATTYDRGPNKGSGASPDYMSYGFQGSDEHRNTLMDFQVSRTTTYGKVVCTTAVTTGWKHVTGKYDDTGASSVSAEIYVNGSSEDSNSWANDIQWDSVGMGFNSVGDGSVVLGTFKLNIVRLSNVARGDNWIASAYKSMFDIAGQTSVDTPEYSIYIGGIAGAEAFGTFSIATTGQFITMTGVPGAEAFGTFQVNINIQPTGVPGGEAFGVFSLTRSISPGSVPGAEAFGVFTVTPGTAYIVPDGVAGGEAFGTFRLDQQILPSGIPGAEAFGVFSLILYVRPTGIPGGEAFGLFRFVEGRTVDIGGIPSGEAFGVFSLWNVWQFVSPDSIPGAEAFGVFTVSHPTAPGQHTQFETDIEEVFLTNNADFAESVEIHYKDDDYASHSLMAIFDNEYIGADVDSEFVVQMRQPMVIIQTRKLRRKLQRGDWMKVRGVTYSVITSEPDGTGISEITLKHKV